MGAHFQQPLQRHETPVSSMANFIKCIRGAQVSAHILSHLHAVVVAGWNILAADGPSLPLMYRHYIEVTQLSILSITNKESLENISQMVNGQILPIEKVFLQSTTIWMKTNISAAAQ